MPLSSKPRNKFGKPAALVRGFWCQLRENMLHQSKKTSREVQGLKRRLQKTQVKNRIYQRMVGQIFARHYNKSREAFPQHLDALPQKYSPEWEAEFSASLQVFDDLNLKPVPQLLDACGFGTKKWEKLDEIGLSRLTEVIERQVDEIVDLEPEEIPAAVHLDGKDESSYQLLPHQIKELEENLEELERENEELKLAGQQALYRIKRHEERIEELEKAEGKAPDDHILRRQRAEGTPEYHAIFASAEEDLPAPAYPASRFGSNSELERENEFLKKELQAREQQIQQLSSELEDNRLASTAIIDKQRQQLNLLRNRIHGLNTTKGQLESALRQLQSGSDFDK